MNTLHHPVSKHRKQHGVALLTAMIFLVVLTLLGIGVFSTTTSEEKMARNFRDKEIAQQAAEAALNEAKILITASYDNSASATKPSPLPTVLTTSSCTKGIAGFACEPTGITNYGTYDLYASGSLNAAVGSYSSTLSPTVVGLNAQPRYLIVLEQSPSVCGASASGGPSCFKIIAQARGRMSTTRVNVIQYFTN
jgi:type IV pilus assembly protein PilX